MKKFLKALQLTSIAVAASAVVLVVVYFFETNTVAGRTKDDDVVATIELTQSNTEATTVVTESASETEKATDESIAVTEAVKETAVAKETVAETVKETAKETVETTPVQTVETTTQPETEKATEAVKETKPVVVNKTETVKETVAAPVQTTLTDVVYKDGAGNTHSYNTIDEAKASINVATLSDAEAKAAAKANKVTYKAQAEEVIEAINAYRTANGLAALSYNDTVATAAMHRAAESAYADWNMTAKENGAKRHIRPNYKVASTIADEYGITGNFGENFGRWQATPDEIVSGWQNSDSHNKLLLGSNYTQIGVGVAVDSLGDFYWVAIFN